MVSIQTTSSVLSGIKNDSFHTAGKTTNNNTISKYSIKTEIAQFSFEIKTSTRQGINDQNAIFHFNLLSDEDKASLLYNDRPISELSVDEANDLISNDGYFGIDKTSQRITDFVIKGAGNDLDRLKSGREGMLLGFQEAEKAWGGKLPNISYETLERSIEAVDKKILELGGSVVDLTA